MRSTNARLQAAYPGAKIRDKSDEPSRTLSENDWTSPIIEDMY